MLADQLKNYLDKVGIHYAWVMAAIVFLFTLATSTIASSPQILILPITQAHGWDISDVSIATGLHVLYDSHSVPYWCPVDAKDWSYQCSSNCYFT